MDKRKKNNLIKVICIRLIYLIIISIVLYDMFFIIYTLLNKNETPSFFGYKTFSIISGSMEPSINVGDLIIVQKNEDMKYIVNDIVTFKRDDDIVTHRIIKIRDDNDKLYYITKGDNNEVTDEKIEAEKIEGRVVYQIPYMGNVVLFLKNKIVFGVFLIGLILSFIKKKRRIARKIRRREKRQKYERMLKMNSINEENKKTGVWTCLFYYLFFPVGGIS